MQNLIEQFNNMKRIPLFEIELDDEYHIFHIMADDAGLHAGGVTNSGFHPYHGLSVEWDDSFSLDEHLQELYDVCLTNIMEGN